MHLASDDREFLGSVDQVSLVVAHDAGRASVDECLDACLLASLDDGTSAVDIDLFEDGIRDGRAGLGGRGGGMDDDIRLEPSKDLEETIGVGDVGLYVLDAIRIRAAVALASQVDNRDGG